MNWVLWTKLLGAPLKGAWGGDWKQILRLPSMGPRASSLTESGPAAKWGRLLAIGESISTIVPQSALIDNISHILNQFELRHSHIFQQPLLPVDILTTHILRSSRCCIEKSLAALLSFYRSLGALPPHPIQSITSVTSIWDGVFLPRKLELRTVGSIISADDNCGKHSWIWPRSWWRKVNGANLPKTERWLLFTYSARTVQALNCVTILTGWAGKWLTGSKFEKRQRNGWCGIFPQPEPFPANCPQAQHQLPDSPTPLLCTNHQLIEKPRGHWLYTISCRA